MTKEEKKKLVENIDTRRVKKLKLYEALTISEPRPPPSELVIQKK